ncbi:hypothetical protein D3273_26515 [Lichenibacterium minor]|uniref:Uncharacterized protein n=1 Tax=Lichenibacterium minor TaxID=2316528 RepID=A0A4Q2TXY2_9HYPH|nr:hypothetical protein [Lichenibacterium minor]RYC28959.1 hypothetical protein D3273_26515 [Lichenibacterium minor]
MKQIIGRARRGERRLRPWLRNNYDLLQSFIGDGRADWAPVIAILREVGVEDAKGQIPSRETLARAWRAISEQRDRERMTVPAQTQSIARGVRMLPSMQTFSPAAVSGRPGPRTVATNGPTPSPQRRSDGIREPTAARNPREGMPDAIRRAIDRV